MTSESAIASGPFVSRLASAVARKGNPCSVGLDPDPALMPSWLIDRREPKGVLVKFGEIVIDAVAGLVPVVKPQSAFYEAFGSEGIAALETTMAYAREKGLIVLLDVKRGDIGSTSKAYARAYLHRGGSGLEADAITLNPYLGRDSLEPFVDAAYEFGKGVFVCVMTSNPGAGDVQKLQSEGRPVYRHVAEMVGVLSRRDGEEFGPIGIVAGATYAAEGIALREMLPRSIILVPGLGAQGGATAHLRDLVGPSGHGAIVNSSRGITYPNSDCPDEAAYGGAIRQAALDFIRTVTGS
ncbi:MAG TPA: orotidine-5'-phosphate decarboxylase [Fimbriimonadaceae bacterium]|nr:orotidine-5'-phosphate decarboxylase [Fimbriimonadaceae bacterium]